jgi:hypothetical protein
MARRTRGTLASRSQLHLVFVGSVGAAAVASMTGACYEATDTYPNWTFNTVTQASSSSASSSSVAASSSSSSGSGGGGGSEPTIDCSPTSPLDKKTYFQECVLGNRDKNEAPAGGLVTSCVNGNCHLSGNIGFLSPEGLEYDSLIGYISESTGKGFIVKDAGKKSRFITYPATGGGHSAGEKWKPEDPSDPLYPLYLNTVTWLDREAADIVEEEVIETDIINPKQNGSDEFNPTPLGFVYVPLDVIADETGDEKLKGAAITFFSVEYSDTLLELTDLKLWPAPGVGIEIKDIGFRVTPPPSSQKPSTLNTTLYGDAMRFVSPKFVEIGSGDVLLTNWEKGASLFIQFKSIQSLLADKHGNAYLPCKDVPRFAAAVKKLPYDGYNCDKPNGLQYCGRQCHGGSEYTLDPNNLTNKMDVYPLFADPVDYPLACAIARTKITPGNVATSSLLNLPNPAIAGNPAIKSTHASFKFCGSSSAYTAYRNAMSPWICGESGTTLCGGSCIDTNVSAQHCGVCNNSCPSGQVCTDGTCGCPNNTKSCNGACVDVSKDSNNCGDCGVVCMAPQTCSGGMCK